MCAQEAGVEGVPTDFKNTKRRLKASRAERIASAIQTEEVSLIASVVTGISNGRLVQAEVGDQPFELAILLLELA